MFYSRVRLLTLVVVVSVCALQVQPAHAGLIDGLADLFGALFGGSGGSGNPSAYGRSYNNSMANPYEGYLNGAANVTAANAQYQVTIQEARLLREEARRSALQTYHESLKLRQYERSLRPDPEKIRQEELSKSLQRSRNNPTNTDIWSGKALNDLLRAIQTAQMLGGSCGEVSLSPDVLKHLNVTSGTTTGGVGLLRDGGKQTWPATLRESTFDTERSRLDELMPQAVEEAHSGPVSAKILTEIRAALKNLERAIDARVFDLTPTDYIKVSRYLRELKEAARVLRQSDVAKYFSSEWTPQGATVADLVKQMTREGLRFAPAVTGDESYYISLHRSLVNYDLRVAQLVARPPATTSRPR